MKLFIVTALIAACLIASCAPQIVYVVVTPTPPPTRTDTAPIVVVTALPLPPAHNLVTESSFATRVSPTLTASAPTRARTETPTRTPTRALSPTPTLTRTPRDIYMVGLSQDEERTIKDAVDLLGFCAPPLDGYVRTHIAAVTRGNQLSDTGRPVVYLPEDGSLYDPGQYSGALRAFVAAVLLVHQARHLEMGSASTEPDAYGFSLPLFENPRCVPNDIGTFTIPQDTGEIDPLDWNYIGGTNEQMPRSYCPFFILHSYTKWRASLPYRLEPPESVHPPEKPRVCVQDPGW